MGVYFRSKSTVQGEHGSLDLIIYPSAYSSPINLSAMAFALINNTIQVFFDSVLGMDHEGMVSMFEDLLPSGLNGFLGCSSTIYEAALVELFRNVSVRDDKVVSTVQGKPIAFSEELFVGTFELPLEGLTDLHEVPQDFVTMKAGSFVAITNERFLMMSAIHGGVTINWGRLLFNIFKDMVTPATRQARGYAVQICVLLKYSPDLELGESKEFPPLKILTAKTVGKYIAKNKNIYVDEDEPAVEKPEEKKKAVSKKRSVATADEPVLKKKGNLCTPTPKAQRRRVPKRKLVLPTGSDDEIVEKEPDVENVVEQQGENTTADDVDKIFYQVISATEQMETYMEEQSLTRSHDIIVEITKRSIAVSDEDDNLDGAENETARKMASFTAPKQFLKEPLRSEEDDDMSGLKKPTAEITRIQFERSIEIREVQEGDWYKASLPKIPADTKGKAPLKEIDTIKGHPAREIFTLICADIDFLVQIRAKVIDEVAKFFNSFSLRRLAVLVSTTDIAAKEERVLTWAETDSVQIALQRREYITTKYRELLLRKFLETRRHNFIAVDYRQSGPRPNPRLLRQAALEALTRSARTNTPRKTRPEQFSAKLVGGGGGAWGGGGGGGVS
ncbi:splicing factor 3B subunit 1-like [Dorcoceras hygrometricum]|uniref:Splicing factor 3B subunit 1-like n=1 Tax=Dorcoceras hygrometricum TaxID=472368 RepID=A0A2Z7AR54_9LAMI|nr:splicing factor 3B subunit 1-like [Dorcoceras hygrometricum]